MTQPSVRTFADKPAVRESVPLLIGIMGPSGGGKTYSALRLATGIQRIAGGQIGVIDTEARRALHYADYFKFQHMEFDAPFGSMDYLAAINHFVSKGVKTIVIDSMTHEHAGVGGYLECAESELDRMAGDNYGKRQACKLASFIKPSSMRRQMIDGILHLKDINVIFCFRAKEKVKPLKNEGKTEIVNIGFMPIAGTELVFEMTTCCLLLPHAGGIPTWVSEEMGEKMMIKTAHQFDTLFAKSEPLSESIGEELAKWAKGGTKAATPAPAVPLADLPAAWPDWTNEERGDNRASLGTAHLVAWWKTLQVHESKALTAKKDADWKPTAAKVDASKQPAA